jgi:hypothetical protein
VEWKYAGMQKQIVEQEESDSDMWAESARINAETELFSDERDIQTFQFDINRVVRSHAGNPELYSLWLSKDVMLGKFKTASEELVSSSHSDAVTMIRDGVHNIVSKIEASDEYNLKNLLVIRDEIEEYIDSDSDELTLIVTVVGPTVRIELIQEYIEQPSGITIDYTEKLTPAVEGSARQEIPHRLDEFVDWSNARPRESFRQTLCLSFKKTQSCENASFSVENKRIKPTRIQKMKRFFASFF